MKKMMLMLCFAASPVWALNKCVLPDGKTVYQQTPCTVGEAQNDFSTVEERRAERLAREAALKQQREANQANQQEQMAQEQRKARSAQQDLRNQAMAAKRAEYDKQSKLLLAQPDVPPAKSVIDANLAKCQQSVRAQLKDPDAVTFEQSTRFGRIVEENDAGQLVVRNIYQTYAKEKNPFADGGVSSRPWMCTFEADRVLLKIVPF